MVISFSPAVILLHFYFHFVTIQLGFVVVVVVILWVKRMLESVFVYWLSHVSMDLGATVTIFPFGSLTL